LGNDYGYDTIFARQVEALGRSGDVVLGFSTSGNSKNVIEALKKALTKPPLPLVLKKIGYQAFPKTRDLLL
jgi:phosphoheptose isomerase